MKIARTVAGVYVLENGEVVASDTLEEDDLPDALLEPHRFEEEYPDAEPTVLSTDRIVDIAGLDRDEIHARQIAAADAYTEQEIAAAGDRDALLVQAVRALEDIDEINNDLAERLRPWMRVHFPELADEIGDHEEFARTVAEHADRDEMDEYADLAADSTGLPIDDDDAAMLERFAAHLVDAHEMRDDLETYVEDLAHEVAPNLATLLGGTLAARIVALAGSLDDLAKMPSSTLQVLGAEKAMFRHMRGEGSAPKHGVLFMHPFVRNVPGDEQGKMARVLANKASIAARLDNYGGDFKGEELRDEVEETYEEVRR